MLDAQKPKTDARAEAALSSWKDGDAKSAIVDFVTRVTTPGASFVPPEERVAVFDNDGTLWCEKPIPTELGFILERLASMADAEASLRERQPWKAAYAKDYAWLDGAVTKHYRGDETDVKVLIGGVLRAFAGMDVESYTTLADAFMRRASNAKLGRRFRDCGYRPMTELLRYLEANGFVTYIASGGDRDFMRTVTSSIFGIPPERVIGSSNALRYEAGAEDGGAVVYAAEPDVFDDGPAKPVRIWSRVGRRPILAGGNANGDIPMLQFAGGQSRPSLSLLVLHDDPEREFSYTAGAEQALALARENHWAIASVRNDWTNVFGEAA